MHWERPSPAQGDEMNTLSGTERVRFNQGFWDGIATRERPNRLQTFEGLRAAVNGKFTYDPVWAEGVRAGYNLVRDRPATSDVAWTERQGARKAKTAERKRIREMRQSTRIIRI